EGAPEVEVPVLPTNPDDVIPKIEALPAPERSPEAAPAPGRPLGQGTGAAPPPTVPITPGTQRVTMLFPRSGRTLDIHRVATTPEGLEVYVARGGINLITQGEKFGIVDIEADEAVIWRSPEGQTGPNGEWKQDEREPLEVYLEGNVVLRQ